MPISAVDAINPAFEHVKQQLFRPFRFGQWVRLAFVGLLAGEMNSGGCNGSFNVPATHRDQGSEQFLNGAWSPPLPHFPVLTAGWIAFLFVAILCMIVVFVYINSVMRFVLFDSILDRECRIRKEWARRKENGFDLFVWQLWLMLVSFAAFVILIGIPLASAWAFGLLTNPRQHLVALILGGILLFFILMIFMVVLGAVHVMTKDFVVPQMAFENISATKGWSRLWELLKGEKGGYALYVLMKIVMAIAAGIVFGILTIIVMLTLLLPIGGIGVIAVLLGKAAGLIWNFYTISLAVTVGCVVFAVLLFAISFIYVPATVFFPAYSIYFFAGRYPPLGAKLWPQPPASATATPAPPQEPPPLPRTPAPFG